MTPEKIPSFKESEERRRKEMREREIYEMAGRAVLKASPSPEKARRLLEKAGLPPEEISLEIRKEGARRGKEKKERELSPEEKLDLYERVAREFEDSNPELSRTYRNAAKKLREEIGKKKSKK